MEVENLTWSEGCGWFDCNKSNDYAEQDGSLCWAATASNLLLWWMTLNKEYIAAYDAEYYGSKTPTVVAPESGRTFERPAPEFKLFQDSGSSNRSPVFEFFKSLFSKSGWETDGVNWFITGDIGMLQTNSKMWGFPGFFSEVFKQSDVIAEDSRRYPTGEAFNSFVTEALQNKKALSISPTGYGGDVVGNHAMTLWGTASSRTSTSATTTWETRMPTGPSSRVTRLSTTPTCRRATPTCSPSTALRPE